jgi:DNA-binding beta-propeller fold protein YncE
MHLSFLSRRRRAVLLTVASLVGLILVITLGIYYLFKREPVTALPGVQQLAQPIPPRPLFSFAGVSAPVGVSVTPDGQRIYVAEGGGQRLIKVFDREGRPTAAMAPAESEPGTRTPGEMSLDPQGSLYVADRLRAGIDTYSPSLEWTGEFRPKAVENLHGWLPNGVSYGPDGRLYVTDIGHDEHDVLVLTTDGTLVGRFGKSTGLPGGLTYPVQAVADEDGRVYVSDGNAARVLAISPRGTAVVGTSGAEALALPRGLAVANGKLFVADARANRVVVFATGDQPMYLYGFGDSGTDPLAYPNAVAVDRSGRVYVADRANDRVQVWTY